MTGSYIRTFKAGELIFMLGDESDCAYIIEEGEVDIVVDETADPIEILKIGDLFGEMGVVDDTPRSTSAIARTDVCLMEIKRGQITNRIENSDPIIRSLVEVMLNRLRNLLPSELSPQQVHKTSHRNTNTGLSKFKLESELSDAIQQGDIQTVYQPIFDIQNKCVAGFEALSRWEHPQMGVMSPAEFINLAEETELIIEVGYLVFDRACDLLLKIPDDKFITINVSVKQLESEIFLNHIYQMVNDKGIKPQRLKLEITETMVVDYTRAKLWISRCKKMGFPVCADDFGTGHAGLEQLVELDFDVLKVDQLFIKNMFSNKKYNIVLNAIAEMTKKLNISLVAEGVEMEKQLKILSQLGFDYAQGYLFGKAMPLNKAIKLINS
ncbi:MAG: EAL domain-containing protein [Proteobacteria bacterium]|nr:EAL domain-containing protein [Pseudomonadota bacterium]